MKRGLMRLILLLVVAAAMARLGVATAERVVPSPTLHAFGNGSTQRYEQVWAFDAIEATQDGIWEGARWEDGRGFVPIAENLAPGSRGRFLSPVLTPMGEAQAVVAEWETVPADAQGVQLAVREQREGEWGEWVEFYQDDDLPGEGAHFSIPHLLDDVDALQWRLEVEPGQSVRRVTIGTLAVPTGADVKEMVAQAVAIHGAGPLVIPRSVWGSTMGPAEWEPEAQEPRAIVVHHTATETDGRDPAAAVRTIDVYHRITRGWGDIGYHYLIDHEGHIYGGRDGGPTTVGAHAHSFNYGTIGIAMVGTFEEDLPTPAALESLVSLTTWLSREYGIQPEGSAVFHDQPYPAIMGHRDTGRKTTCPGDALYGFLPQLRQQIARRIAGEESTVPPGIQLAPSSDWVSGTLTATINLVAEPAVRVELRLDGEELQVSESPFQTTIDTTAFSDGEHRLEAIAHYEAGPVRSERPVGFDNTAPDLVVQADGEESSAAILDEGSALASVAVRRLNRPEIWSDWETLPSAFPVTSFEARARFDGAIGLQWRAVDEAGNQVESEVLTPAEGPTTLPGQGDDPQVNLVVESLEVFPSAARAQEPLIVQVLVVNRGTEPVTHPFVVEVTGEQMPVARWQVAAGLPPDAIVLLRSDKGMLPDSSFSGALPAGEYQIIATVDPVADGGRGAVSESDEGDNQYGPITLSITQSPTPHWQQWLQKVLDKVIGGVQSN